VNPLAALDVPRDEDGRPLAGYQVGKAVAMLDWQHRRDAKDFRTLCLRLSKRRTHQRQRARPGFREAELAAHRERRAAARAAKSAARSPCPTCGGAVERVGATGKVPTYCSKRCMRRAVELRYRERHGDEIRAEKRARYHERARAVAARTERAAELRCQHCDGGIPAERVGRRGPLPRYCSDHCRSAASAARAAERGRSRRPA